MTRGERALWVATGLGLVHHLDHVLRVDHSGWPFRPDVTPFTFSLVVYPMIAAAFLAPRGSWWRAGIAGALFAITLFAHSVLETPVDQFRTWAYGSATGAPTLLGVHSVVLGAAAATITVLLSLAALWAAIEFTREARRPQPK
jgi:hypothetical protein